MISVVVIGKNEGERLAACLKSIQTALNVLAHEVVYVDSCSTDQSLQTAKALGARCFLLAERQTTAGLGRFVGAKEARGEYLLFLDGDMQLCPGFAEKALMAIAAKGYDGVCGIREDVYLRGGEVVGRNENYFGCTQERIAPEFGGALMITREALNACGGWATDTVACEEAGCMRG
ncbi:MAG: glycosyltransferase family 2 protein [Christensenellales bacterium]